MGDYTNHVIPLNYETRTPEQDVTVCNGCGVAEPDHVEDHLPGCEVAMKEWREHWSDIRDGEKP